MLDLESELEREVKRLCLGLKLGPAIPSSLSAFGKKEQEAIMAALQAAEKQRATLSFANALKRAGLDARKTLQAYEFGHFELPKTLTAEDLALGSFIERKENLILLGPSGSGKTHLAIGVGIEACRQKRKVSFKPLARLVDGLLQAYEANTLAKAFASLERLDLLIIDEWGYLPLSDEASYLLFRLFDSFYERRSLVLTTNLVFSEWGSVVPNSKLANAIIDRMAHHSHLLHLNCESYRLKNSLMGAAF